MPTARGSVRRRLAIVPRPVWAATALFAMILSAWSSIVPLYEAPDEPGHADLVFHVARGGTYPHYDERFWSEAVRSRCATHIVTKRWCPPDGEYTITEQGYIELHFPATFLTRRVAGEAPDRTRAPDFEDAGGNRPTAQRNQIPQHPPLYYEIAGAVVRVERAVLPGSLSLDQELLLVRLVSVAMVMWLPLLAWLAARRAGLADAVAVTASFVPLAIPQLAHIGSVVNNDNLLTLLGAGLIAALAGVARGDRSWRTAVVVSVLMSAALLTKTSAVVFVPTVAVAYLIGWRRTGDLVDWAKRLVGVGGGVAAMAGWWFVRNRLDHGTFTPSIDDDRLARRRPPPGFEADFGEWWSRVWDLMPGRFWGSPGWFSVKLERTVAMGASAVVLAAVVGGVLALVLARRRPAVTSVLVERRGAESKPKLPRPTGVLDLGLLLVPFALTIGLVLGRSWRLYETAGTVLFLQGRYLFSSVVGLAVVVAVGLCLVARRATPLVVLVAAAFMHVVVVLNLAEVYWGPAGADLRTQAYAAVAWCPFPTLWWWVVIVAGTLAGLAAVGLTVSWLRSPGGVMRGPIAETGAQ